MDTFFILFTLALLVAAVVLLVAALRPRRGKDTSGTGTASGGGSGSPRPPTKEV